MIINTETTISLKSWRTSLAKTSVGLSEVPEIFDLYPPSLFEVKALMQRLDAKKYELLKTILPQFDRQLNELIEVTEGNFLNLREEIQRIYADCEGKKSTDTLPVHLISNHVRRIVSFRKLNVTGSGGKDSVGAAHNDLIRSITYLLQKVDDKKLYIRFLLIIGALSYEATGIPEKLLKEGLACSEVDFNKIIEDVNPKFIRKTVIAGINFYRVPVLVQQVINEHYEKWLRQIVSSVREAEIAPQSSESISLFGRLRHAFEPFYDSVTTQLSEVLGIYETEKYKIGAALTVSIAKIWNSSRDLEYANQMMSMLTANILSLRNSIFIETNSEVEFDLIDLLGDILYSSKRFEKAREAWLCIFDEKGAFRFKAAREIAICIIYRKIANTFYNVRKYKEAKGYYRKSIKFLKALPGTPTIDKEIARVYLNLALVEFEYEENFLRSASHFRENSIILFAKETNTMKLGQLYGNYAQQLFDLGRNVEAKNFATKAVQASICCFLEKKEPGVNFTDNLIVLARVLIALAPREGDENFKIAFRLYLIGMTVNKNYYGKVHFFTANIFLAYAKLLYLRGQYAEAIKSAQQAENIFRKKDYLIKLYETKRVLGEIYIKETNPDSLNKAEKYLLEALTGQGSIFSTEHSAIGRTKWALANLLIAKYCNAIDDTERQELLNQAIQNAKEAFEIFEKLKHPFLEEILLLMRKIHEWQMEFADSLSDFINRATLIREANYLNGVLFIDEAAFPVIDSEVTDVRLETYLADMEARIKLLEAELKTSVPPLKITRTLPSDDEEDEMGALQLSEPINFKGEYSSPSGLPHPTPSNFSRAHTAIIHSAPSLEWYDDEKMNFLIFHVCANSTIHGISVLKFEAFNEIALTLIGNAILAALASGNERLFVPLQINNNHWCGFFLILTEGNSLLYWIDPYGNEPAYKEQLIKLLNDSNLGSFTDIIWESTKFQEDGLNCGPWLIEILQGIVSERLLPTYIDMRGRRVVHEELFNARNQHTVRVISPVVAKSPATILETLRLNKPAEVRSIDKIS